MSADDGDFKSGRFRPGMVLVGLLLVAGAGTAGYLATKSSNDKLTVDQISTIKKDIYVLPQADQAPKWRQLAGAESFELQQEALTQLYFLEDKQVASLATAALDNVDHRVRGMAATVLSSLGPPAAEPARAPLVKAFKEANDGDRPQLAWALVVLNEKPLFKDILELYKKGQLAGVTRVGGGKAFDVETFGKMATPDEWAALSEDPNIGVRQMAASILSKNADKRYLDKLIKLVKDKDIEVAREATNGLGKIGDASAMGPMIETLSRAGKDDRQAFLEALRDGIGGAGLVLALPSVAKEPYQLNKVQTQQIFNMLRQLADPRAGDGLVKFLETTKPLPHFAYEAAMRLAEIGDPRAAKYLGDRLKLNATKIYDKDKDPELVRDDNERIYSARMLADLAVLNPTKAAELRAAAEDGAIIWSHEFPQPHANALRFLAAAGSTRFLPDLRKWANPTAPLPKDGEAGNFSLEYATAASALRYLGWTKDESSWGTLEKQLGRKDPKDDITQEGLVGAGISMRGMVLRGIEVGSAQGFAQWGDRKAFPILFKFIDDEKQHEDARLEACRSMAWVGNDEDMKTVLAKAKTISSPDAKKQFLRACHMEALIRHPVAGTASDLLSMLTKDQDLAVRRKIARAIAWSGVDAATETALFEKMKDPAMMNDAALALILGGSGEAAARAVALYNNSSPEALDDLKDQYFDSFGYWSDDDLAKGRIARWVNNANAIAKTRVRDSLQEWARLRLGAQFNNLEYDNGPHSMTRVVLRSRLAEIARKGDTQAKTGAIEILKFMQEQGTLMALRDVQGDTGELARRALFELMNPKSVV